jgi:hypothetical protein
MPRLDLLPAFEQEPTRERLYFTQDEHWSPAGHAFVAELLRRRIAVRDL